MAVAAIQKQMEELVIRLEAVEETCRQLRKENADIKRENKFLQRETTDLQISMELKMEKLEGDIKKTNEVMAEFDRTSRRMNKAIYDIEHLTNLLSKRLTPLEERQKQVEQSEVDISLDTDSLPLIKGQFVSFTKVKKVNLDGGTWDGSNLRVHLKTPGCYLINLVFSQKGDGKILVNIKSGKGFITTMGETTHDDHVVTSTIVLHSSDQDHLWLEVGLRVGGATLRACEFAWRLL